MQSPKPIILKPGDDPEKYAPCDAIYETAEKSVKLHPMVLAIRNKRKRSRIVKSLFRRGVKSYLVPQILIIQTNAKPKN
jgi:hypothetical protein